MKKAFTLAETLIVMGIIGIVAALTLPNLNSSTGDKEKVTKVKKIYSELNDAFGRAEAVYGPVDEWCVGYSGDCKYRHFDRITEFLKISKSCDKISSCSTSISTLDKNGSGGMAYEPIAILSDGAVIAESAKGQIVVDIDGAEKGANKQGSDVFKFLYDANKGVYVNDDLLSNTSGYVTNEYYSDSKINMPFSSEVNSCEMLRALDATAWIINFDNMDYLKTTDGTTCPNGTKLTVGGNHSCK